jgi:hypothetical protein
VRHTSVCRGDRTNDRRDPPSRLTSPGSTSVGACGHESARSGESGREDPAGAAPAAVGERTRKEAEGPRERVRLPGKGKLWRGAPGTRAAWNKAARRRGPRRTAGSKRPRASRETAGTAERGKNPEGGTDEGLAILVPHGRPQGRPWRRRGTRRSCVRGSKNLTRGRPARSRHGTIPLRRGRTGGTDERAEGVAHRTLERTQPQEGSSRGSRLAARFVEEYPEVVEATWGERRKPIKRYSVDNTRPCRGRAPHESRTAAGDRSRLWATRTLKSLERPRENRDAPSLERARDD